MKRVAVIGSGFAGLAAATSLAANGFDVTILEKNAVPGGRARRLEESGFRFDMGPSWYWMPDVFEKYFARFGASASDYYQLERLDPSYRIYYGKDDFLDIPAGEENLAAMFERIEPGSGAKLHQFLAEGKFKYDIGINTLVYKPGLALSELLDRRLFAGLFKMHVFQSLSTYVRRFFSDQRLVSLLEFPVLFLGATADRTPALYSLMNYADMVGGTWYPKGGMFEVVRAMVDLAKEKGVKFRMSTPVRRLEISQGRVTGLLLDDGIFETDYVVAAADYHHVEQQLLPAPYRQYSDQYWQRRVMAPSSLLFYLGLNRKYPTLRHHTLFFDEDFKLHASEIYDNPSWPTRPQFYLSCTSNTDPTVAPPGHENLVILIPVAPGLQDSPEIRENYYNLVMDRFEKMIGEKVRDHVVYKKTYAHSDFINDYNAFRGNAYGLANTLLQTANLKPSIRNKKVKNLFYSGQLTVPGPGVPPSLISGQVVADQIIRNEQ